MKTVRPLARLVFGVLLLLPLVACAASGVREPEHPHTLVILKSGPNAGQGSKEERAKLFTGHFANMTRLAEEGKLLVAGPYVDPRRDASLRGIFVFETGDVATAQQIAATDPGVQAGEFRAVVHTFTTDAPLHVAHDRAMAHLTQAKAEGKELPPGSFCRPYVLLTVENGDAAWGDLVDMLARKKVYLLGVIDHEHVLAVLDARDREAAEALLAPIATKLGPSTLDPWFATEELTNMVGTSR